jgi:hypothetical protein
MLWDNALTMFYAGMVGGLLGAFLSFSAMKGNRKQDMQMLELYWNEDIRKLNLRMDSMTNECIARNVSLYQELSQKSGDNSVGKGSCFSHGKPRD